MRDGMNFFIYEAKMDYFFAPHFLAIFCQLQVIAANYVLISLWGRCSLSTDNFKKKIVQNGQSRPEIQAIWCSNIKHLPLEKELNINCLKKY